MNLVEFPYEFKIKNNEFCGELYATTGVYAGGSITTTTTTETKNGHTTETVHKKTKILVRTSNGKVSQVTAQGDIDVPSGSPVTIFYHLSGDYYTPFFVHIHDFDRIYLTFKNDMHKARRATSKWGFSRRAYGRLIDLVHIVAALAVTGLGIAVTYDALGMFFAIFAGIAAGMAFAYFSTPLFEIFGGTFSFYAKVEKELWEICKKRAQEIDAYIRKPDLHENNSLII
ncbi:hypothetical protein I3271_06990 [Photobacterium leiognathi]|uniref:hypothetical protein n=1 Tax=Photobacterium leiognathi TaxID=553611 RepID=UPI001EDE43DD|nr:hypothetical protein [Photobacterium leiognathi]MCG3884431.1 hypothetical protein [Photobacterium leiognathi]